MDHTAPSPLLTKMPNKVAGKNSFLTLDDESLVIKETSSVELDFYERSRVCSEFASCLPTFYGVLRQQNQTDLDSLSDQKFPQHPVDLSSNSPEKKFICLENITRGFIKPCIMDIKIGFRLYDDFATPEKKFKMIKKAENTTSGKIGLRLCGYQIYKSVAPVHNPSIKQEEELELFKSDPQECRALLPEELEVKISQLFLHDSLLTRYREYVIKRFIYLLEEYLKVVSTLEIRLYSSSLLFVYEIDYNRICSLGYSDDVFLSKNTRTPTPQETFPHLDSNSSSDHVYSTIGPVQPPNLKPEAYSPISQNLLPSENHPVSNTSSNNTCIPGKDEKDLVSPITESETDNSSGSESGDYCDSNSDSDGSSSSDTLIDLRAIDFAHSTWELPGSGPDVGYLSGLKNLLSILKNAL
ncbi:Inositol polyphosphate multikinase [Smittium mucronatum]|uniref:Kinase n=1 Tax=Smittium mucronatum TaxID=133383 RepID=A0A1R0H0E7_9FUNG|nr:Inositol polyphosphate multikinase [Smittium mucronatum]